MNDPLFEEFSRQSSQLRNQAFVTSMRNISHLVRKSSAVIDFGSDTGTSLPRIAQLGFTNVYCVDINPNALVNIPSKYGARPLCVDLETAPIPLPDACILYAQAFGLSHFLADLSNLLQQATRLLQKGGVFLLETLETTDRRLKEAMSTEVRIHGHTLYMHMRDEIVSLIQENKLQLVEKLGITHSIFPHTGISFYVLKKN